MKCSLSASVMVVTSFVCVCVCVCVHQQQQQSFLRKPVGAIHSILFPFQGLSASILRGVSIFHSTRALLTQGRSGLIDEPRASCVCPFVRKLVLHQWESYGSREGQHLALRVSRFALRVTSDHRRYEKTEISLLPMRR